MNDPSVTQILPKLEFFCTPEQLELARQEGQEDHSKIKMYWDTVHYFNNDTLVQLLKNDEWLKKLNEFMLSQFSRWGNILQWEKRLFSEKYKFNGKSDMVFEDAIVDLKRSFINKNYHALQLTGYNILAKENKVTNTKNHIILWYDGTEFKFKNVYNSQAEDIFLALLKKYRIEQAVENYLKLL